MQTPASADLLSEDQQESPAVSPFASTRTSGIRIAYLLSQYPARSHTFLLHEVLGLRARGLHIEVASINTPDRPSNELPEQEAAEAANTFYVKQSSRIAALLGMGKTFLREPGVVVRGLRAINALPNLSIRERLFWLFYLAEAILIGRWMRERNLPHLHVHFGGAVASVGMLTSIAWRIPYSLTIHGPEELLKPAVYQLPAKLAQASFVICISEFCRNELRSLLSAEAWTKFTVISLGVDPNLLVPAAIHAHTGTEPLRLVCVGRLVEEKGHRVLLESLAILHSRGIRLHAVLIGTGPLETELQQQAKSLRLQNSILFTSGLSHHQTLEYVHSADIFVLASFAEGVPVALMEAMSLGVPCVSTTIAGIPELIESGTGGLLVSPGDPVALAGALEQLAGSASLRHRLGSAGRERVIARYNLPRNLDHLAQHFRGSVPQAALTSSTRSARIITGQA